MTYLLHFGLDGRARHVDGPANEEPGQPASSLHVAAAPWMLLGWGFRF